MLSHLDSPQRDFLYPAGRVLPIVFSGWAFSDAGAAESIRVVIDGTELFTCRLNIDRGDVKAAFPQAANFNGCLGFKKELPLAGFENAGRHAVEVFAADAAGKETLINQLSFEIFDDPAANFSKRYSGVPAYLLLKVNGFVAEDAFQKIGERFAGIISESLGSFPVTNALDFGCGLGRVLHPLAKKYPAAGFTGFDIDPSMIDWAKYLFENERYGFVNSVERFKNASFDFIYAISVFTHLDETTDRWLAEIKRLLKSNGRAFLTYHDETLYNEKAGTPVLREVAAGSLLEKYYVTGKGSEEGDALMGTFYTTEYWQEKVSKYFSIVQTVPRGVDGYQSYSLLKNC